MNDFKLKMILAILMGVVFSFIFILLAFVMPTKEKTVYAVPKNKLGKISEAVRDR